MAEHVFEVGQPIIYINDFGRPEFVTVAHPPRPLYSGRTVLPINGRTGLPAERNGYDIVAIERCHPYPALTAHPPAVWGDVQGLSFRDALRSQMIVALGEQLTEKEAKVDRLTAENEALRETLVEVAGGIGWRERDVWGRVIGQGTVWIELSEDADRVVREVLGITDEERTDG